MVSKSSIKMLIWGIGNYCFTHINLGLILRNPIQKKQQRNFYGLIEHVSRS